MMGVQVITAYISPQTVQKLSLLQLVRRLVVLNPENSTSGQAFLPIISSSGMELIYPLTNVTSSEQAMCRGETKQTVNKLAFYLTSLGKYFTSKWNSIYLLALLIIGIAPINAYADPRLTHEQFLIAAENCASSISPEIMAGIVHVESRFHPYAIGVGGKNARSIFPKTKQEAIVIANRLVRNRERFDAGLGQINVENFSWLNITISEAFDVCKNLSAAETVLREGYDRARKAGENQTDALRIALSTYNTGHSTRGVRNGYVGKVMHEADSHVTVSSTIQSTSVPSAEKPHWDVFGSSDTSSAIVFTQ